LCQLGAQSEESAPKRDLRKRRFETTNQRSGLVVGTSDHTGGDT
jgi:hypothetical protein